MLNLRTGFATLVLGVAISSMAACTGNSAGLPGGVGASATVNGGTGGTPSQVGSAQCDNKAPSSGGTMTGTAEMGSYQSLTLPGSFTAFHSEAEVTARITQFSLDTSPNGAGVWTAFQCLYAPAVAQWKTKSH
jgi:hypothetical protein